MACRSRSNCIGSENFPVRPVYIGKNSLIQDKQNTMKYGVIVERLTESRKISDPGPDGSTHKRGISVGLLTFDGKREDYTPPNDFPSLKLRKRTTASHMFLSKPLLCIRLPACRHLPAGPFFGEGIPPIDQARLHFCLSVLPQTKTISEVTIPTKKEIRPPCSGGQRIWWITTDDAG